jgi:pyruvate/2-oxoglutarate dehydrogenase complex dihydrolipoamide dehydrogenase (E3) component
MATEHYQNVVIGSGEAGKFLAWSLARQGQKTIVVERSMLGGACPNVACLPSKNVIYSAKVASLVNRAAEFGISTGPVKIDMGGVFRRKQKMIDDLMELHRKLFHNTGAELVMGQGRFVEPKTIGVALNGGGTRVLKGERVFLAVGTRASVPDIPGLADAKPMAHVEALNLERLPEHLVILGGGYVALEFAQALRRFGSRVTIIGRGQRLLKREDPDVAVAIEQLLKDEGIAILLDTVVENVSGRSGEKLQLQLKSATRATNLAGTDVLVATGRMPNTDLVDADRGGVELDSRGYIRVNDRLETTVPDVWAMGECAGSPQFTHISYDDFRIVYANLGGGHRSTRGRLIPYCLFTDPELAHVGMTEADARAQRLHYRIAKIPMAAIMRTRTHSENRRFIKALIGDDDRILGFTAFGAEASELMAAVQGAMLSQAPYTVLRDGIFAHPTVAEGLTVLFANPLTEPTATMHG